MVKKYFHKSNIASTCRRLHVADNVYMSTCRRRYVDSVDRPLVRAAWHLNYAVC